MQLIDLNHVQPVFCFCLLFDQIGYIVKNCTPTLRGFDSFFGYYEACIADYWYHFAADQCDDKGPYVDLSNNTGLGNVTPSSLALNGWVQPIKLCFTFVVSKLVFRFLWLVVGTYNAHLFTDEAIRLIKTNVRV